MSSRTAENGFQYFSMLSKCCKKCIEDSSVSGEMKGRWLDNFLGLWLDLGFHFALTFRERIRNLLKLLVGYFCLDGAPTYFSFHLTSEMELTWPLEGGSETA